MADEKLVEEVAQQLAMDDGGSRTGLQYIDMSRGIFRNPALIKRMAEGVGLEVKERPVRYTVRAADSDHDYCRVSDGKLHETVVWMSPKAFPDATEKCQALANEKNSKERG